MFNTLLISSPLVFLFIVSLVCLVLGWKSYKFRNNALTDGLSDHTLQFFVFGNFLFPLSGSMLLFVFTKSSTVLLVVLFFGLIVFLGGELTLRALIIARKEYYFAASITISSAISTAFLFPLLIHMHEPFIAIYSFVSVACIPLQIMLVSSWKSMRRSKKP